MTITREVSGLRNTPSWQGYLVCWVVAAAVFVLGLFASQGALEGHLEEPSETADVLILLVAYFFVTLVVSGLGMLPVTLALHFLLRGVAAQAVHVLAFGLAVTVVYGALFALAEPVLSLAGFGPGAAAAVGRLTVAGRRWRRPRGNRPPRTGW